LKTFHPCLITSDGNCFFRSLSMSVYGNEKFHQELRARCIIEMIINFEKYVDSSKLNSMLENPIDNEYDIVTALANMTKSSVDIKCNKFVFLMEIKRIAKMNEWCPAWLFFVMANALNITIKQFFPNASSYQMFSKLLNAHITPLSINNRSKFYYLSTFERNSHNFVTIS
jgi:hypothetical protein